MDTFFAPAEKAGPGELQRGIEIASRNPVINGILKTVSGLLAVLNEQRQTLAVNDTLLKTLGIADASKVFGLRPGEAINCVHAHEMPGGCGTSKYCSTCGAAIAIVTGLANDNPAERKCVATLKRNSEIEELCFRVRACPITIEKFRFILLFLQDITANERRAALERMFFHDLNNIITGLMGISELMGEADESVLKEVTPPLQSMVSKLQNEVMIQHSLLKKAVFDFQPSLEDISVEHVIVEIEQEFSVHPASRNKLLHLPENVPRIHLVTDISLLFRVLSNMLINAFEATDEGEEVKLWTEQENGMVTFCVWNRKAIPEEVARRIFQRHFSTKPEDGRGLGTYIMKLIGEQLLRGKIDFTSDQESGTAFSFSIKI
jgi:hypothetical protein